MATFSGATFSGQTTSFYEATFSGKNTWFGGATFSGETTSFYEADFSAATEVSFTQPRAWNSVKFDWDEHPERMPTCIRPQDWPPQASDDVEER